MASTVGKAELAHGTPIESHGQLFGCRESQAGAVGELSFAHGLPWNVPRGTLGPLQVDQESAPGAWKQGCSHPAQRRNSGLGGFAPVFLERLGLLPAQKQ